MAHINEKTLKEVSVTFNKQDLIDLALRELANKGKIPAKVKVVENMVCFSEVREDDDYSATIFLTVEI